MNQKLLLQKFCCTEICVNSQSFHKLQAKVEHFPYLLLYRRFYLVFIELIGAMYRELYLSYDSFSHEIKLELTKRKVNLPIEKSRKQDIFKFLVKLLEELFIKASLINQRDLQIITQDFMQEAIKNKQFDSACQIGLGFVQNLTSAFKMMEVTKQDKRSLDYLSYPSEFGKFVQSLIAKRSLSNTIDDIIAKSLKIKYEVGLDASQLATAFRSVLIRIWIVRK